MSSSPARSPRRRSRAVLPFVLGAAVLLGACGADDGSTEASPDASTNDESASVIIEASRFDPDELTVAAGTEVVFENLDPYAHTVTSADGSELTYDSGEFGEDETFSQRFDEVGSYDYFCRIHPTMRSTIVVE